MIIMCCKVLWIVPLSWGTKGRTKSAAIREPNERGVLLSKLTRGLLKAFLGGFLGGFLEVFLGFCFCDSLVFFL